MTNEGDGTATGVSVRVTSDDARVSTSRRGRRRWATSRRARRARRRSGLRSRPTTRWASRSPLSVRTTFAGALSPTYVDARFPTGAARGDAHDVRLRGPAGGDPGRLDTRRVGDDPRRGRGLRRTVDVLDRRRSVCTTNPGRDDRRPGSHVRRRPRRHADRPRRARRSRCSSGDGGGGNNLCRTVFDDSAAVAVQPGVPRRRALHGQLASRGSARARCCRSRWTVTGHSRSIDAARCRHRQHPGGVPAHHGLRRRRDRSAGVSIDALFR